MSVIEAPPELVAMQRLVRALVTAPTGVAAALDGRPGVPGWLDAWAEPSEALAETIRGDARLSAPARLDVYAEGYFARLLDVLEGDYPTVAWLCGEAAFNDLVTAYLVAHPSRSPTLRDLGAPFAEFLADHPVAAFARDLHAGIPDVARLEWAFAASFDAPDAPVLERADLAAIAAEHWAEIPLATVPAFSLLGCEGKVGDVVAARKGGAAAPTYGDEPQSLAVWRADERSVFRVVQAPESDALERVVRGETFGDLCAWVADHAPGGAEAAASVAAGWLAAWVDHGWLAALPPRFGSREFASAAD